VAWPAPEFPTERVNVGSSQPQKRSVRRAVQTERVRLVEYGTVGLVSKQAAWANSACVKSAVNREMMAQITVAIRAAARPSPWRATIWFISASTSPKI